MMKVETIEQLKQLQETILRERDHRPCVRVCGGTGCRARGSEEVLTQLKTALQQEGMDGGVEVKLTGCHGLCERGPLVMIHPQEIFYQSVEADDVKAVVAETVKKGAVIERLLATDPVSLERVKHEQEIPFYRKQQRR